MKICKKCKLEKSLSDFHNDLKRKGGKYPHCKECQNSYMRDRYANVPGTKEQRIAAYKVSLKSDPNFRIEAKRRSTKHSTSIKGRASILLRSARKSPDGCSLTLDWVMERLKIGICPITRIAFDFTNEHQLITGRTTNPYAPSLDRIEPKGSYSSENTRVVVWWYNMTKGELTDRETFYLCRIVSERFPQ